MEKPLDPADRDAVRGYILEILDEIGLMATWIGEATLHKAIVLAAQIGRSENFEAER